ncbi:MAG: VWA domain-containing protein [bacterium]
MKKYLFVLIYLLTIPIFANGVAIYNDQTKTCLRLMNSKVEVTVNNQVAVIKTTQTFLNNIGFDLKVKYGFPLNNSASATQLKWKVNNTWYMANISATPQDTSHPGGNTNVNIQQYLGATPLYFSIPTQISKDSTIIIELTYVQLLDYQFGKVYFSYPNDYRKIQTQVLIDQVFDFKLHSDRTIESILFTSHTGAAITNDGNNAQIYYNSMETQANTDFSVNYSLSLSQLGLFGFSTFIPDSVVPDNLGSGFFTFVVEPDPSENTTVINKRFTFIVDRSGSMMGSSMDQAKEAANFVVNNLNEGDKFNIVSFAADVTSFMPQHVDFNQTNKNAALSYIQNMQASGSTNISGAFNTAITQFTNTGNTYANIIIFFTDGEPTAGITNTNELNTYIQGLITQSGATICIYNFGIGGANRQLLNLIASNNNGFATFLGTSQLQQVISDFYLTIRNPVLLNPQISFQPNIAHQIYPVDLPDLYKGKQMIISGRYLQAGQTNVRLTGNAFGNNIEYNYAYNFSGTSSPEFQFLTKIWAKSKIEHLLVQYYNLNATSPEAIAIKAQIVTISQLYGVISEFTSFSGGVVGDIEDDNSTDDKTIVGSFELLGNYPNPFNPSTTIRFMVNDDIYEAADIRIFNSIGQLICVLRVDIRGKGTYEVQWNGKDSNGRYVSSGVYLYALSLGNTVMVKKMVLTK